MRDRPELPGLYVHVPFCRSKCAYCGFASGTDLSLIPAWLTAVKREMALYAQVFPGFDTLYLGGGTPSLLAPEDLATLMECLCQHFTFPAEAEVTLEANPEDISADRLRFYQRLGINRLSLGVQSFDDRHLAFLGRRHTGGEAVRALECIRASGLANLGVDLIAALPGQTPRHWRHQLKQALAWQPEHLSCYELTWEEGTRLASERAAGRGDPPGEESRRRLFLLTSRFLEESGYLHYEISNFAQGPSHLSRHNRKYWRQVPYLGLGPAAHSFRNGRRWWNHRSLAGYCQALEAGAAPVAGSETLSPDQVRMEAIFLGFRTREGIPLELIRHHPRGEVLLSRLAAEDLVKVTEDRVAPTLRGFLVADSLALLF